MQRAGPSSTSKRHRLGQGIWQRFRSQRRRVATLAAGTLAIAVGYHVVFGHNGLTVFREKRQATFSLQRQLEVLRLENEELKSHVGRLENDPTSIEHQAREELHYTRPGEVIVTLGQEP